MTRLRAGATVRWLLLAVVVAAVVRPQVLAPNDPTAVDFASTLRGPSLAYPLGTDPFGRCILSRLIHGVRPTVGSAALVAMIAITAGVLIGMASSSGRAVTATAARSVVGVVVGVPGLVVAMAVVGIAGPGTAPAIAALSATAWAAPASVLGVVAARERSAGYVMAATAAGATPGWIARRHLLPAIAGRAWVLGGTVFVQALLTLSGLSVLGLGPQPPSPEWGAMLNESRQWFFGSPTLIVAPAAAIAATAAVVSRAVDRRAARLDVGLGDS